MLQVAGCIPKSEALSVGDQRQCFVQVCKSSPVLPNSPHSTVLT